MTLQLKTTCEQRLYCSFPIGGLQTQVGLYVNNLMLLHALVQRVVERDEFSHCLSISQSDFDLTLYHIYTCFDGSIADKF